MNLTLQILCLDKLWEYQKDRPKRAVERLCKTAGIVTTKNFI